MIMNELIKRELILTNIDAEDQFEALKTVQKALYSNGYVKDTYFDAVLDREKEYPTGIALGHKYNIAIPHTDSQHVIKSGICIGVLKEPVKFKSMENKEIEVDVKVIFMIALNIASKQVELLQELMALIRDAEFVEKLTELNEDDILNYIKTRKDVIQ